MSTKRPTSRAENETPRNPLEAKHYLVSPQTTDEFLGENNVGLGDYDRPEFHQQMETFADFQFAESAFGHLLLARAERRAARTIARQGFDEEFSSSNGTRTVEVSPFDATDAADGGGLEACPSCRSTALREAHGGQVCTACLTDLDRLRFDEYAREQWRDLDVDAQLEAIRRHTSLEPGADPAPARAVLARHEFSRSKQGTLLKHAATDRHEVERVETQSQS